MNTESVIMGFLFSTVVSTMIMHCVIDCLGWRYLEKDKDPKSLTLPLGIFERILYTTGFLIGTPNIIGVWLALKVAVHWRVWTLENQRSTYNLFLIGSALSLLLSYIGASIAAQEFLTFKNNPS